MRIRGISTYHVFNAPCRGAETSVIHIHSIYPPIEKFNTSKNTKEWFSFAKHLFITDNHAIRQSQDQCNSSTEAIFSQQELKQINGITNSLQCDTREAIRIALFEIIKEAHEEAHSAT